MNPITDLLSAIDKLITEHGSASILRERIVQLREQIDGLIHENERLQKELSATKREHNQLRHALEQKAIPNEYLEHRGVLFRRLKNGNIQDEVYCPDCKKPMSSIHAVMPFVCSKCRFASGFTGHDLKRILSEIE